MRHIQNPAYYHNQTYSGTFASYSDIFSHFIAYLETCVTLAYSEPYHNQNPGIFRTRDIFRTLSRHNLAYLELLCNARILRTVPFQNFAIFRILAYLGAKTYSEPYQISNMKGLTKLVKRYLIILLQRPILIVWQGSEHASVSISVKYLVQWY